MATADAVSASFRNYDLRQSFQLGFHRQMVSRFKILRPLPIKPDANGIRVASKDSRAETGGVYVAGVKKVFLEALGWALLAAGIAGLLLPILPGIPLAIAGLLILSREYAWAHRLIQALRKRFPRLAGK